MDKTAETDYPWVISRLEQGKPMRDLAYFDGEFSLLVSPDSKTLVLFTDVDVPNQKYWQQDAIFRSDDQGETWRWLKEGFFPEIDRIGNPMGFYMHGTRELWRWRNYSSPDDDKKNPDPATWSYRRKAENLYTELYYSPDFGENVETIPISNTLFPPLGEKNLERIISPYVVQLSPDWAIIWLSQEIYPKKKPRSASYITTKIELRRVDNRWRMQAPQHFEGMAITALHETGNRVVAAMILDNDEEDAGIVEFDPEQQTWKRISEPPNPFFPLSSSKSLHTLLLGEKVLFLGAGFGYNARWLFPFSWFDDHNSKIIYAPFFPYYSLDQGRSWRQLAIEPMAFQPEEGRIFWVQDHELLTAKLGQDN
jgi:hypothetical protein